MQEQFPRKASKSSKSIKINEKYQNPHSIQIRGVFITQERRSLPENHIANPHVKCLQFF